MFGMFTSANIYILIGILILGLITYFERNQITVQRELIKNLSEQNKSYEDSISRINSKQIKIQESYAELQNDYETISNTYKAYMGDLNEEFDNYTWDEGIIPHNLYCRIECMYKDKNKSCDCSLYTSN